MLFRSILGFNDGFANWVAGLLGEVMEIFDVGWV